jgi:hypothetical protein
MVSVRQRRKARKANNRAVSYAGKVVARKKVTLPERPKPGDVTRVSAKDLRAAHLDDRYTTDLAEAATTGKTYLPPNRLRYGNIIFSTGKSPLGTVITRNLKKKYNKADDGANCGYSMQGTQKIQLSNTQAQELSLCHTYYYNRPFNIRYARQLVNELTSITIVMMIDPDGLLWIADGQHRLAAHAMSDSNRTLSVAVIVYACKDKEAVASLFDMLDDVKKRTPRAAVQHRQDVGQLTHEVAVSDIELAYLFSDWSHYEEGVNAKVGCGRSRVQLRNVEAVSRRIAPEVQAFAKFLVSVRGPLTKADFKYKLPVGIGSAVCCMHMANPEEAEKFVRCYLTGNGSWSKSDPRNALRNYVERSITGRLMAKAKLGGGGAVRGSDIDDPIQREYFVMAWRAWSSFCAGRYLAKITPPKKFNWEAAKAKLPSRDKWDLPALLAKRPASRSS